MAVSMEVRKKVVSALGRGETKASIARRFEISAKTVARLQRRFEATGDLRPDKTGPKGSVKLTERDEALMRERVAQKPGVTAVELMPELEADVVESTVCRALRRLGLRLKKSH